MKRAIVGTVLAILALEILIFVPLLYYTPTGNRVLDSFNPTPTPTPQPILTVRGTPPSVKSAAAYMIDADTGNTLVDANGQKPLPMASTTKIMTALLAIEKGKMDQVVTVQGDAPNEIKTHEGASTAGLVSGDQLRLQDVLYGLMLPSGNDAAITIADTIAGSVPNFVKMMNDRAKQLHLSKTQYTNPNGLTPLTADGKADPAHANTTSASDLVHLTSIALKNPLFAEVVRIQRYVVPANGVHHAYTWETTNHLLESYPGTTGVKTGFADEAGYCLVFAATDGKHNLIGAVLHDSDQDEEQRFTDASELLDWGFHLPLLPPPTKVAA